MKKFVLIGGECTGKSTLAAAIGKSYKIEVWDEFATQYAKDINDKEIRYSDVATIVAGQLDGQERKISAAQLKGDAFVLGDTDLISSYTYSKVLYHRVPEQLEATIKATRADAYFLLSPKHVPFRSAPERRQAINRSHIFDYFLANLNFFECKYEVIEHKSWNERFAAISNRIQAFLQ